MPHYRIPHSVRVLHNILDVFRTYETHELGWTEWPDRVFYRLPDGSIASLSQLWGNRPPLSMGVVAGFMHVADRAPLRYALRAAAIGVAQVLL
ncbi:MAG TPA: hypothetical protein VGQ49_24490 [Bryobacteraceae bacterium]|jgi:hypothetical protein|nr:hypothetical protein [Bryobacteraceae bacterium]